MGGGQAVAVQTIEAFVQEIDHIAAFRSVHAEDFGVFVAQGQADGPFAHVFVMVEGSDQFFFYSVFVLRLDDALRIAALEVDVDMAAAGGYCAGMLPIDLLEVVAVLILLERGEA